MIVPQNRIVLLSGKHAGTACLPCEAPETDRWNASENAKYTPWTNKLEIAQRLQKLIYPQRF